jgi:hypothetical protein
MISGSSFFHLRAHELQDVSELALFMSFLPNSTRKPDGIPAPRIFERTDKTSPKQPKTTTGNQIETPSALVLLN